MNEWMNSNFLLLMSEANVPGPQNVKKHHTYSECYYLYANLSLRCLFFFFWLIDQHISAQVWSEICKHNCTKHTNRIISQLLWYYDLCIIDTALTNTAFLWQSYFGPEDPRWFCVTNYLNKEKDKEKAQILNSEQDITDKFLMGPYEKLDLGYR